MPTHRKYWHPRPNPFEASLAARSQSVSRLRLRIRNFTASRDSPTRKTEEPAGAQRSGRNLTATELWRGVGFCQLVLKFGCSKSNVPNRSPIAGLFNGT